MGSYMINPITDYLSSIGSAGGKAGRGKSKARTSTQARKAAMARWAKKRHDAIVKRRNGRD